jgi:hypothetical protein
MLAAAPLVRGHYGAPSPASGGAMARALTSVVAALAAGGSGTHSPAPLLAAVVKAAPSFRGRQQQDAHELLRVLLDGVRTDEDGKKGQGQGKKKGAPAMGPPPPPRASASFAERVFGGLLASRLVCGCGEASESLEAFMDLSLPVPVVPDASSASASALPPRPKPKPTAPLTAKQRKRAAKADAQREKAAADADADADAPSSASSAPRPTTPAPTAPIDVPAPGSPPPDPFEAAAAAGSSPGGGELGPESPFAGARAGDEGGMLLQ